MDSSILPCSATRSTRRQAWIHPYASRVGKPTTTQRGRRRQHSMASRKRGLGASQTDFIWSITAWFAVGPSFPMQVASGCRRVLPILYTKVFGKHWQQCWNWLEDDPNLSAISKEDKRETNSDDMKHASQRSSSQLNITHLLHPPWRDLRIRHCTCTMFQETSIHE